MPRAQPISFSSWWTVSQYISWIGRYETCFQSPVTSLTDPNRSRHPVLEHTQSMFFPRCEKPSFTPTWNCKKKCLCAQYINCFEFVWCIIICVLSEVFCEYWPIDRLCCVKTYRKAPHSDVSWTVCFVSDELVAQQELCGSPC
jgi:hypothetical protein